MATEILRPNNDVSVQCSYVGSILRWQNVDEEVASDADFNFKFGNYGTNPSQDILGLADSGVGAGVITNVSLRTRLEVTSGGDWAYERARPKLIVGGTSYYGTTRGPGTARAEYTDDWANNPAGGAWTWAAINALQIGYEIRGDTISGKEPIDTGGLVFQQYIIVTYTPPDRRSYGYIIG